MVLIPIKDINRRVWVRFHYVTVALIALCAAVYAVQIAGGAEGVGLIRFFKYPHVILFDQSEDGDIKVGGLRLRQRGPDEKKAAGNGVGHDS